MVKLELEEAQYTFKTEPTLLKITCADRTVVGIFDGTACWGCGREAAAWSRAHLQALWTKSCAELTLPQVEHDLAQLHRSFPDEFRAEEFGCHFSVMIAIAEDEDVSIVAAGMFSVCLYRHREKTWLFKPKMLVDQLVQEGKLSSLDVTNHPLKHVFLGSVVGATEAPDLVVAIHRLQAGDTIIAAHNAPSNALSVHHAKSTPHEIQKLGPPRPAGPAAVIVMRA